MSDYNYYNVKFKLDFKASYIKGNSEYTSKGDETIKIEPETVDTANGLKTRLCITNISEDDVFLNSAYPVCIKSLSLGETPSKEWVILNNGRHKNDLPSVCVTGKRDCAFDDAVNRLSEEGKLVTVGVGKDAVLTGDQISVIHTDDCSLAISFDSADIQLTEILIPVDKHGNVGEIAAGGEFNCLVAPHSSIYTDWICVDCQKDSFNAIEAYSNSVKRQKNINVPDGKFSVYSTWYYYGKEVTMDDIVTNLKGIKDKSLPFTHFQIDAGWEKAYGDWTPNQKFANGMKAAADLIKAHGMQAGIWTAPLIVHSDTPIFAQHPEWLLKHTDGTLCIFYMGDIAYNVLDCTNPEVIKWIEDLYRTLKSWGYTYHKLDFTRAFAIQKDVVYHNPYMTAVQAYTNAMKAAKRAIGKECFLLVCGGLYQPLAGVADGARTGSDVLSIWNRENGIPKIPFTVKQNVIRYFMNKWWFNDPDSLMVRRDEKGYIVPHLSKGLLTDDEAITFTANQYFGGGLICSTEPIDKIDNDRLYLLKHVMPVVPTKVTPLNMFKAERFISMIDVYVKKGWHTLCFVNWSDKPKEIEFTVTSDVAEAGKTYYAASFFGKQVEKDVKLGSKVKMGTLNPHSTEIVKIAPQDVPQVVKSDCHFSMGGETDITFDNKKLIFKTSNKYPIEMHYTVALPNGKSVDISVPGKCNFEKAFDI